MRAFVIISLVAAAVISASAASAGYYVPRAYYTIDENGEHSPLYFVDPALVHRVRRSPQQYTQTSTSTGTATGTGAGIGGNIFFNPLPGFGGFPNFGAFPGGQSTFTSTSTTTTTGGNGGGLDNRFGGDDTKVTGHTQTVHTQNGQFTQTSSHLGDDGKIHFNVQSGKF